ncbi:hypothetical protein CRG98_021262 [Punica granatum]|uniref:Secreted protein n=1 Tax=Punica granatum TaxID=22663 RepID=A0A2I0JPV3_PUNGR|nr:hypothetical protein CRG98_021262 [Punica granatum]
MGTKGREWMLYRELSRVLFLARALGFWSWRSAAEVGPGPREKPHRSIWRYPETYVCSIEAPLGRGPDQGKIIPVVLGRKLAQWT